MQSKKTMLEMLHSNRDENSFTARLFEGILFPQFYRDHSSFKGFLEKSFALPSNRFTEADFTLFKTIQKKDGKGKNLRHLLKY